MSIKATSLVHKVHQIMQHRQIYLCKEPSEFEYCQSENFSFVCKGLEGRWDAQMGCTDPDVSAKLRETWMNCLRTIVQKEGNFTLVGVDELDILQYAMRYNMEITEMCIGSVRMLSMRTVRKNLLQLLIGAFEILTFEEWKTLLVEMGVFNKLGADSNKPTVENLKKHIIQDFYPYNCGSIDIYNPTIATEDELLLLYNGEKVLHLRPAVPTDKPSAVVDLKKHDVSNNTGEIVYQYTYNGNVYKSKIMQRLRKEEFVALPNKDMGKIH